MACRLLGVAPTADALADLQRGVELHRQLWQKRDRLLPLLLLGEWWGECAAE